MTLSQFEKIALNFSEARENAGKTQADVANYLGVTYQAVSNWERGRTKIDSVSLLKSLLWFRVDIYEFLGKCDFDVLEQIGDGTAIRERALLKSFHKVKQDGQEKICSYASDIAAMEKYQINNSRYLHSASAAEPEVAPAEEAELAHQILQDKKAEDESHVSSGAAGEKKEA